MDDTLDIKGTDTVKKACLINITIMKLEESITRHAVGTVVNKKIKGKIFWFLISRHGFSV